MSQNMVHEADLSIEVVILLIFGIFMLIFGALLVGIQAGALPYSPDSTYGLFLVLISFQIITMGKTPFGDLKRSWLVVIIGMTAATLGMIACFVPGYITDIVRILVGFILCAGGITLLFQLYLTEGKAKVWVQGSGLLRRLLIVCTLVYLLSVMLGLITLAPGLVTDMHTSILLMLFGISILFLSWCIMHVRRLYPSSPTEQGRVIP